MKFGISILICIGITLFFSEANAQIVPGASEYHEQALLFSQNNYTGTARIQGLGGAQVSLGGDLSSALSNPAGLGFYNRSEFNLTSSYNNFNTSTEYLGQTTNENFGKFFG